jgi:hypothetical protein
LKEKDEEKVRRNLLSLQTGVEDEKDKEERVRE